MINIPVAEVSHEVVPEIPSLETRIEWSIETAIEHNLTVSEANILTVICYRAGARSDGVCWQRRARGPGQETPSLAEQCRVSMSTLNHALPRLE